MAWETTFTSKYLQERSEQCRVLANQMLTSDARRTLMSMAEDYHQQADRAEQRELQAKVQSCKRQPQMKD